VALLPIKNAQLWHFASRSTAHDHISGFANKLIEKENADKACATSISAKKRKHYFISEDPG